MTEMVFMIFSMMAYAFSGSSGGFSSTSAAILKMKTGLTDGINPISVPGPKDFKYV